MLKKDNTINSNTPEIPDPAIEKPGPSKSSDPAAEILAKRAARRAVASAKMLAFLTVEPPKKDFIFRSLLRGTVGVLVASGSTGKTYLSLEIACCVASKKANDALLQLDISKHGKVVIISAEDPESILHDRIYAIAKHLKFSDEDFVQMSNDIEVVSLLGREATDMNDAFFKNEMLEYATDTRLAIFDTLNRLAGDTDENSNSEMGLLLKSFEFIAARADTGVLILHHSSKDASKNGTQGQQEAARGASSITSNVRWQSFMQRMTEAEAKKLDVSEENSSNFVQFGGTKENYGPRSQPIWLKRNPDGVLLPFSLLSADEKAQAAAVKKRAKAAEDLDLMKNSHATAQAAAKKQEEIDKHVNPNAPFDKGFTTAEPYVKAKMAQQKKVKVAKGRTYAKA
jgi:RecA-family ATPase